MGIIDPRQNAEGDWRKRKKMPKKVKMKRAQQRKEAHAKNKAAFQSSLKQFEWKDTP